MSTRDVDYQKIGNRGFKVLNEMAKNLGGKEKLPFELLHEGRIPGNILHWVELESSR